MPAWAAIYFKAWQALEHDRSLGQGGAMTGIHYTAISRYGADKGFVGLELARLVFFVRELDDEYRTFTAEKVKEEIERQKQQNGNQTLPT